MNSYCDITDYFKLYFERYKFPTQITNVSICKELSSTFEKYLSKNKSGAMRLIY